MTLERVAEGELNAASFVSGMKISLTVIPLKEGGFCVCGYDGIVTHRGGLTEILGHVRKEMANWRHR